MRQIVLESLFPPGEIYVTYRDGNPSVLLGFGTWSRFSQGRVLVGADQFNPTFTPVGKIGGVSDVFLNTSQMPFHGHAVPGQWVTTEQAGNHSHQVGFDYQSGGVVNAQSYVDSPNSDESTVYRNTSENGNHQHNVYIAGTNTEYEGGNEGHTNLQPYTVVNMWVRTA